MKQTKGALPLSSSIVHTKSIIDSIEHTDWCIHQWKIKFLFSEKQLHQVRKQSGISNWYEDRAVADAWIEQLCICFNSIQAFHATFGVLPQIGDRLYDEDSGLLIQDRSIDGGLKTVTYTLTS